MVHTGACCLTANAMPLLSNARKALLHRQPSGGKLPPSSIQFLNTESLRTKAPLSPGPWRSQHVGALRPWFGRRDELPQLTCAELHQLFCNQRWVCKSSAGVLHYANSRRKGPDVTWRHAIS